MIEMLVEFNWVSITVRLALSLLCSGVLGFERERKGRAAGLRTYMLVCIGATLVMLTNHYIYNYTGTGDIARLGAQVISGIGFLGAGSIIVTGRNHIKGLTTAAGLWASACIGLAIGIGFYYGAIIGTFFIYLVMAFLQKVEGHVVSKTKNINLYIDFEQLSNVGEFFKYINEHYMKVCNVEVEKGEALNTSGVGVFLTLLLEKNETRAEVINVLRTVQGIRYVEEI